MKETRETLTLLDLRGLGKTCAYVDMEEWQES